MSTRLFMLLMVLWVALGVLCYQRYESIRKLDVYLPKAKQEPKTESCMDFARTYAQRVFNEIVKHKRLTIQSDDRAYVYEQVTVNEIKGE